MKRILSILVFLSLNQGAYWAQCVPDSNISGYFSPSFDEGLPSGEIGIPYDATIMMRVPSDTVIIIISFNVDSLRLIDIEGLPDGLSWTCNTADCSMPGGSFGCIRIQGTPTNYAQIGVNPLTAKFLLHLSGGITQSINHNVTDYSISLGGAPQSSKSIESTRIMRLGTDQVPASMSSYVVYNLPGTGNYSIGVYTILGSEVATYRGSSTREFNKLPIRDLIRQPGIYFITIRQGQYAASARIMVQ